MRSEIKMKIAMTIITKKKKRKEIVAAKIVAAVKPNHNKLKRRLIQFSNSRNKIRHPYRYRPEGSR